MSNYKSNNHVSALAEQKFNYFSPENIMDSLTGVKKGIVDSFNKIKNNPRIPYYAYVLNEELKGSIKNFGKNPIPITTLLTSGALVLSAPAIEEVVNSVFNTNYNSSQSKAAELEIPYQIFEPHINAVFDVNRNSWLMEQEAEIKNDPRFKPLMKNIYSLLNYPNPNHELLMDLDKITSIKFKPNETNEGYDAVVYVGPMLAENAITISAGEIFNIPNGVDIRGYMDSIFSDAFYINEKYENLLKERKNEADREAKKNELIETRQNVISKAQQEKQETIDDIVDENLSSGDNTLKFSDLEGFKEIPHSYMVTDADEFLGALDIPADATITHTSYKGIDMYNIVSDCKDPNDGTFEITPTKDGFKFLCDVIGSPQGYTLVSTRRGPCLGNPFTTTDAGAVISGVFANEKKDHYVVRALKDGKPSFAFFSVPKDMDVRRGEILANNINGVDNVGGIGQEYNGAEFKFPVSVSNGDGKDDGGSDTPVIPPVTPTPQPTPEQELNDNNDPQDPANTGSDPNTGDGSTPEDPVVNPDPDPHIF